jgi:hypothetical protein
VTALLCGCVPGVTLRVPRAAVANLPLEQRLTLLDAESDVLAAQDARDRQEEELQAADNRQTESEGRVRSARQALSRARETSTSTDIAAAALEEATARLRFAERTVILERELLTIADLSVELARARFELARAHEVDAAGQGGRFGVRLADYQHQADAIARAVDERMQEDEHVRAAVADSQQAWKSAAQELAKLTGGGQGSVWVQ